MLGMPIQVNQAVHVVDPDDKPDICCNQRQWMTTWLESASSQLCLFKLFEAARLGLTLGLVETNVRFSIQVFD